MPSKAVAGYRCDVWVSYDGTDHSYVILGEMRNTTITVNQEPIDVTSYATDGWLEYITGLRSWEASTEGLYISGDAGLRRVRSWLFSADNENLLHWAFVPKRNQNNSSYYKGQASLDSLEMGIAYEDAIQASFAITGSGALIRSTYTENVQRVLGPNA